MNFSYLKRVAFSSLLLFTLTPELFAQDTIEHKNSVTLGGYFASFNDIDGRAYTVGYQYELNRYITFEGNLSHASASNFPDYIERQSATDTQTPVGWYSKTAVENIATYVHFSIINNSHHFFSLFGGIGYMQADSSDYIKTLFRIYYSDGTLASESASYYLYVEKKNFVSKNYGLQYKYSFNNGFQVGVDLRGVSPLGKNTFLGQPDYLSAGLLIGKTF
jgi:hypothetical protein